MSFIYNSAIVGVFKGEINFESDKFKVMLLDEMYDPDRGAHAVRSDLFGEVVGIGYPKGGSEVPVRILRSGDKLDIFLGSVSWERATITAKYAVYYKDVGVPSLDIVLALIDFGGNVISTNGSFSLSQSTIRVES